MATYQDKRGRWHFRRQWTDRQRQILKISGTPEINTRRAAEVAERKAIEEAENPKVRTHTTTFAEFWTDRYLPDWCGPENKAGTIAEKRSIYLHHLQPAIGDLALADITTETVQKLKAALRTRKNRYGDPISAKTADNILTVVAHALTYAEDIGLIEKVPKVRLYGAERREPTPFTFAQLDAFLGAASAMSDAVHVAALLAADAGLRIGEIFALEAGDLKLRHAPDPCR
ncbi:MAG TPA: hypothetical protein VFG23_00505 [Polyangia bacterium]|nr:hypothetical protein [Polyangia bacterium]